MKKNGKYRVRRNIGRCVILLVCMSFSFMIGKNSNKNIIENEKVKIEYFNTNKDFDIIVTPKNDYNITPEWNLESRAYYGEAYLVGKTKENAKKFFNMNKENYNNNFLWNQ